jgi:mannan endo-1,4-beta-mannosidase
VDDVAAGLRELQGAGVPVLFRPFHEMNGNWFWWGAREPGQFQAMWRAVHDHLTKDLGLDNLLFVYSPNQGERVMDFYPGDAYVDVVALDYYGSNPSAMRTNYEELTATGKPFAIGEFGPGGPEVGQVPSAWDFRILLDAIKTSLPRTVWWQSWEGVWGMQNGAQLASVLGDPWVRGIAPARGTNKVM